MRGAGSSIMAGTTAVTKCRVSQGALWPTSIGRPSEPKAKGAEAGNEAGAGALVVLVEAVLLGAVVLVSVLVVLAFVAVSRGKRAPLSVSSMRLISERSRGTATWYKDGEEYQRINWEHGVVFVPTDGIFHQHFNTGSDHARYLAIALGSMRYPFVDSKRKLFGGGVDTSVKDGGNQIEYENQDPRIHEIFLNELAKNNVKSNMGDIFDESKIVVKKGA